VGIDPCTAQLPVADPDGGELIGNIAFGPLHGPARNFTLHGEQPQVDAFVTMIKPWVGDRHGRLLDKLPEATEPPKVKPAGG